MGACDGLATDCLVRGYVLLFGGSHSLFFDVEGAPSRSLRSSFLVSLFRICNSIWDIVGRLGRRWHCGVGWLMYSYLSHLTKNESIYRA